MDSGNGSNSQQQQQQRYCPTPIMAPPSVATSPPVMSGAGVMGSMHQPTHHHPSPSISPHPGAYYGHHSSSTSHYPTPTPTPPPPSMHHQQYYAHAHPYYTHGSHQQQQQQPQSQSQQSHHPMSSGHVPMSSQPSAPPQNQHPHYPSYHHPHQPQSHHQQWGAPSHSHQQQSHPYYHQPAHHNPPQQQTQQHGYPPPPHSPYPYPQTHSAAPTPPPQQQQHAPPPPPVPASPGPGQIHQAPQQNQSHALMNLSRFVSQQSPSPSPRASPSLAHHQQQIPQMGAQSPSPFSGHLDHHATMNGHSSGMGSNTTPPVMSPPPPMVHSQQAMSPPPSIPVQQHHLPTQSSMSYNVNGSIRDRHTPTPTRPNPSTSPVKGSKEPLDFRGLEAPIANDRKLNEERELHNAFSSLSANHNQKDSEIVNSTNMMSFGSSEEIPAPPSVKDNSDSVAKTNRSNSNNAKNNSTSGINSSNEMCYPSPSPLRRESVDNNGATTPDISRPNGSGVEVTPHKGNYAGDDESSQSSVSPQARPLGSPTSTGNGHQMMPVRLQNMQKGARTKASMKKLMQEQHIAPPNGQASDVSSDGLGVSSGKETELELVEEPVTKGKSKTPRTPKKKKSQSPASARNSFNANESLSQISMNSDLAVGDDALGAQAAIVIRPGYTKSGKKIGRPRKDSLPNAAKAPAKVKGTKKAGKAASKKGKSSIIAAVPIEESAPATEIHLPIIAAPVITPEQHLVTEQIQESPIVYPERVKKSPKRKGSKGSRSTKKRVSKAPSDTSDLPEMLNDLKPLISPDISQIPIGTDELNDGIIIAATPISVSVGKKKGKNASSSISSNISPEVITTESIPVSEITPQEAESVALNVRVVQTPVSTPKSRRKGKKLAEVEISPDIANVTTTSVAVTVPKEKKSSRKNTSVTPLKELDSSPERGDLPRLRSRSPKQGESPPLRMSSPRTAKERSITPSASTTGGSSRSPRASRSREKDVPAVATVAAPVVLRPVPPPRSPKKASTEKVEPPGRVGGRAAKGRKSSELLDISDEYLSSPPVKRTRQVSKESSESGEISKGTWRGLSLTDTRASVDSDRSLSLSSVGKRSSRRKSGSVSGSTDSLLSPSISHASLAFVPPPEPEVPLENMTVQTFEEEEAPSIPTKKKGAKQKKTASLTVKRGKGKATKSKSKSKKRPPKVKIVDTSDEAVIPVPVGPEENNDVGVTAIAIPEVVKPAAKVRRQRKSSAKSSRKGKKAVAVAVLPVEPHSNEPAADQLQIQNSYVVLDSNSVLEGKSELISSKVEEEASKSAPAPLAKQKGRKRAAKQIKNATAVLSIPEPQPVPTITLSTKRKTKGKVENKKPRQYKSKSKQSPKKKEPEVQTETDPYHFESSDITGTSSSVITDEESKPTQIQCAFIFSPPQNSSPFGRRRRSSAMSPVNTQSSARRSSGDNDIGTELAVRVKSPEVPVPVTSVVPDSTKPTAKPLRRDSRSLSREMNEVSVVLSDIARSPEFSSLSGISEFNFSQTPLSSPVKVPAPTPPPALPPTDPGPSNKNEASIDETTPVESPQAIPSKKKKRAPKRKASTDLKPKRESKKKVKLTQKEDKKTELQERKANLEKEVAQVLLDLKSGGSSGASSKSPSPAKSILGMDLSEMPSSPKKKSRGGKSGRRRKSTSPRLSVDSIANKQENIVPLPLPTASSEIITIEANASIPVVKKTKGVKGRRLSAKAKLKSKQVTSLTLPSPIVPYSSPHSDVVTQSLNFTSTSHGLETGIPVKVAKTAVIPTASSLGIPEHLPSPIVPVARKRKTEKVKKPRVSKSSKCKPNIASPDITEIAGTASDISGIRATSTPKPASKLKRKKPTKAELKAQAQLIQEQDQSIQSESFQETGTGTVEQSTGVQEPVKKKRQRRARGSLPAATPEVLPSTSTAGPSTSKLFPYQTEPQPYKTPTIFAKSASPLPVGKDDNQKSKLTDGPSLRVIDGIAKFFRGEVEEELDPDPRLPKEKAQLTTDNAVPWICSFCHLGPHVQKLGDLFGPYFANLPAIYGTSPKRETWMHGDCALWAGRLILIGSYLRRLEETLVDADKETCTVCKKTGATIGCLKRGCKEAVHYPCAIRRFWKMDEKNFHSYCPKHTL